MTEYFVLTRGQCDAEGEEIYCTPALWQEPGMDLGFLLFQSREDAGWYLENIAKKKPLPLSEGAVSQEWRVDPTSHRDLQIWTDTYRNKGQEVPGVYLTWGQGDDLQRVYYSVEKWPPKPGEN